MASFMINRYTMEMEPRHEDQGLFMNELRKNGTDCDLSITCSDNIIVRCHKNILRFHCDHEKWTFDNALHIDVSSGIVTDVIEHFYLGNIDPDSENLSSAIKVCDALEAKEAARKLRKRLVLVKKQFLHFTFEGKFFEFNHEYQSVKVVKKFSATLKDINIIVDGNERIGINLDGKLTVFRADGTSYVYRKKVCAFVNDEGDSVFLFTDNSVEAYKGGFTKQIPTKCQLIRKIKCDIFGRASIIELRVINKYMIVGRQPNDLVFTYRLERPTGFDKFKLAGENWSAKYVSEKGSPFVVYTLGYNDAKPTTNTYTLMYNRYAIDELASKVAEREMPLDRDTYCCVANYYNSSKMLLAVNVADPAPDHFEFRLYDMDDYGFETVSDVYPKRNYVEPAPSNSDGTSTEGSSSRRGSTESSESPEEIDD